MEIAIKKSLLPKDVFRHDIADRGDVTIVDNELRLIEKLLKTGFSLR